MRVRWWALVLLAAGTVLFAVAGFTSHAAPAGQIDDLQLAELATRVAQLEEQNAALDARVTQLEATVAHLAATPQPPSKTTPEGPLPLPGALGTRQPSNLKPGNPGLDALTPNEDEPADPEPTPTRPAAVQADGPAIDWGPLPSYFEVGEVTFGTEEWIDNLGRSNDLNVMSFPVRVKRDFVMALFQAHFYDADGFEIDTESLVEFDPDYMGAWRAGLRSVATVVLPVEMDKVAEIRFKELR